MKKITPFMVLLLLSSTLIAQENKTKELGIMIHTLNSYGIIYKTGSDRTLLRVSVMNLDFSKENESGYENLDTGDMLKANSNSFGVSVAIGFEKRKELSKRLELRTGLEGFLGYRKYTSEEKNITSGVNTNIYNSRSFNKGIRFVLGFHYSINDDFSLGAEILPALSHSNNSSQYYDNNEHKASQWIFSVNSSHASMTLAFKF